jgi:hypothetical protein
MDFADLDPRPASEAGADLHIKNPSTGEPVMDDGAPVLWRIRGPFDVKARKAFLDAQKLVMLEKIDDQEYAIRVSIAAVMGWPDGTKLHGKTLKCNAENVEKMIRDQTWLVDQIFPFFVSKENFPIRSASA